MCRSVTENAYPKDRDRLKIRAFYLRLFIGSGAKRPLPEALTLVYLPRISETLLEVNGSNVRPDVPAFLTLHRVRSAEPARACSGSVEAVYVSTDRVRAGEGARFEVFVGAERALKGVFRAGGVQGRGWQMECRSAAEGEVGGAAAAEVCVAGEGGVAMVQSVELAAERKRRRTRGFCSRLEVIPEESDGCDCSCCGGERDDDDRDCDDQWEVVGSDGWEEEEGGMEGEDGLELEVEGVKWAVDVGIWAVCLGVGLLVSRASYKGLRGKILF